MKNAGLGETWGGQRVPGLEPAPIAAPSPRLSGSWFGFCCFPSQLSLLFWLGVEYGGHCPPPHCAGAGDSHPGWSSGLTFRQLLSLGPRLGSGAQAEPVVWARALRAPASTAQPALLYSDVCPTGHQAHMWSGHHSAAGGAGGPSAPDSAGNVTDLARRVDRARLRGARVSPASRLLGRDGEMAVWRRAWGL